MAQTTPYEASCAATVPPPPTICEPRVSTPALQALGAVWSGHAFPVISGTSYSVNADCSITVTWTTDVPSDTRLAMGKVVQIRQVQASPAPVPLPTANPLPPPTSTPQVVADDTLYAFFSSQAQLVTAHSATKSGTLPETEYAVVVMSTDAAGRQSATAAQVVDTGSCTP
jgi:hypothetical protein